MLQDDYSPEAITQELFEQRLLAKMLSCFIDCMIGEEVRGLWPDIYAKLEELHAAAGKEPLPEGYSEYIQSEEWKRRRAHIIDRYGGLCCACHATDSLHVHHRTYRDFRKETPTTCIALCERCHAYVHPSGRMARDWIWKTYPNAMAAFMRSLGWGGLDSIARRYQAEAVWVANLAEGAESG